MTEKDFMKRVTNGKEDVLQIFLDVLAASGADYCVIGGLAVNAYAEPVVSLDLDIVVAAKNVEKVCASLERKFRIQRFERSVNLSSRKSDLRIQLQTDPRYQPFIQSASVRKVLGYQMKVASLEDVLQGKLWAYQDEQRRPSKRQKDMADILRLVEAHPELEKKLPASIRKKLE